MLTPRKKWSYTVINLRKIHNICTVILYVIQNNNVAAAKKVRKNRLDPDSIIRPPAEESVA